MRSLLRAATRYPLIPTTILVGAVVLVLDGIGAGPAGQIIATAYVALVIAWTLVGMVREVLRGHVGLDILAVVAMAATLAVSEYVASLIIVLMLAGGEALEDFAGRRARRELSALLDRSPRTAHREQSDGSVADVPVDEVNADETLLVRPSEVVPVDGVLLSDEGSFDESSLTGESMPATHSRGDEIMSGSVNGSRAVRLRTVRTAADSQYQQIIALVREAEDSRAPVVRLADRFAVPFTAVSLVLAGAAWGISGDPTRFAEVLVLATPCPLLIAAPVAFLGGLSRAAKAGVILKGGSVIEQLARARSAAFDKTGTLTRGRPMLTQIRAAADVDVDELLTLAASAEEYSTHVFAEGIGRAATERGLPLRPASAAEEVATAGVRATIDGHDVAVGKLSFVEGLASDATATALSPGEAAAYVAIDGRFAGALVLADDPRPESAAVVTWLRGNGIERTVMLTGDAAATANSVAASVGIDQVHAELLPPDKVRLAAELQPRPVVMVGDGVNDAPVLAAADVGIAMGARGSTAAGDAASAVILQDSLSRVVDAIAISRHTLRVAFTAIWIGIALSVGLMLVAMTGLIPAVAGALVQEVVDLATILYALRALGGRAVAADARGGVPTAAEPGRMEGGSRNAAGTAAHSPQGRPTKEQQ